MPGGRPSGLPLDSEQPSLVQVASADVDDRGRMTLPAPLARAAAWLHAAKEGQDVLLVLSAPGVIELRPWEPDGEKVIARKRQLEGKLEKDPSVVDALRILHQRYRRLSIAKGYRTTLPSDLRVHLGVLGPANHSIYVVRTMALLEILTKEVYDKRLAEDHSDLSDLP